MPVHKQLPVTGQQLEKLLSAKMEYFANTCLLAMCPEIADEVAIGKARLQLGVVAGSADLDSLHLDE